MRKNDFKLIAFVFLVHLCLPGGTRQVAAQAEKAAYPAMAPVDEYLIADQNSEIALARSAAPASISDGAEVMVLGRGDSRPRSKGRMAFSVWWSDRGAPPPTIRNSGIPKFARPFALIRRPQEPLRRSS